MTYRYGPSSWPGRRQADKRPRGQGGTVRSLARRTGQMARFVKRDRRVHPENFPSVRGREHGSKVAVDDGFDEFRRGIGFERVVEPVVPSTCEQTALEQFGVHSRSLLISINRVIIETVIIETSITGAMWSANTKSTWVR